MVLLDEGFPVDRMGIKGERLLIGFVERVPQPHQIVDAVQRFAFSVLAVDFYVAVGLVENFLAAFEFHGVLGHRTAQRQLFEYGIGTLQRRTGPVQLFLDATTFRESP